MNIRKNFREKIVALSAVAEVLEHWELAKTEIKSESLFWQFVNCNTFSCKAQVSKTLTLNVLKFKRMVRLKYPIILISKLDSGLWVCPDNIFPTKIFFNLRHTASFILYTFLFSFHKKPCSQFSWVCVTLRW